MGDMEDAFFIGPNIAELGGRFGIGVILERKWGSLARQLDSPPKVYPMGSPEWVGESEFDVAEFDGPVT